MSRKRRRKPPDKCLGAIDESTPLGYCAADAAALHQCLDEEAVPRLCVHGETLSLWGRVNVWREMELRRIVRSN